MPSDAAATSFEQASREPRWAWLYSQGLGVLCGQLTVLLLAVGSVVLAATRDGASAMIAMDDIRGFFAPPSAVHLWFYLLIPTLGLYALNTLLATWLNVARRWRAGIRAWHAYAAAVVHVGFLLGLLAHGVGGLWGGAHGQLVLGSAWQSLDDGRQARLVSLDAPRLPDGGLKQIWAEVEVRDAAGRQTTSTVSYNGPLSSGLGSHLLLLTRPVSLPVAHFERAGTRCQLEVDGHCELARVDVSLLYLHPPAAGGGGALARVRVEIPPSHGAEEGAEEGAGEGAEEFWLAERQATRLADGSNLLLERIERRPGILLQRRYAPGNPWALAASIVMIVGLALMWRRFLPAERRKTQATSTATNEVL